MKRMKKGIPEGGFLKLVLGAVICGALFLGAGSFLGDAAIGMYETQTTLNTLGGITLLVGALGGFGWLLHRVLRLS